MTVVELKGVLRERGLKVSGRKAELLERLQAPEAREPNKEAGAAPARRGAEKQEKNGGDFVEGKDTLTSDGDASRVDASFAGARLATQLGLAAFKVAGAVSLFQEGCTLPFVARYRKEQTGGLDEVELRAVQAALESLEKLEQRRNAVLGALATKSGVLTPALRVALEAEDLTMARLEDIYRPYRPKRRTRAGDARTLGLDPLAHALLGDQRARGKETQTEEGGPNPWFASWGPTSGRALRPATQAFLAARSADSGLSLEAAVQGAQDIVAEVGAEDPEVRAYARQVLRRAAAVVARERTPGESDPGGRYRTYHAWRSGLDRTAPHNTLALNRGEAAKALAVEIEVDPAAREAFLRWLRRRFGGGASSASVAAHASWHAALSSALEDGVDRLLLPSLKREWRRELTNQAEAKSFEVYATNLRNKLLQPPIKGKVLCALDPGLRSGTKVCVLSPTGAVLAHATLMLPLSSPPSKKSNSRNGGGGGGAHAAALAQLLGLLRSFGVELVAVGNGTGSREAVGLVLDALRALARERKETEERSGAEERSSVQYTIVDESGASVYSASPLATAELPDLDVSIRGAVSLGRRVLDPLAELVKIDPKAIGVGMYQHDVDQKELARELARVVESAVNSVGVDLNGASPSLLAHVAGLNPTTARAIVSARDAFKGGDQVQGTSSSECGGRFSEVAQLRQIKGIGPKAFEQCAGFLRVYGGKEPLDATAVHPESYIALRQAVAMLEASDAAGGAEGIGDSEQRRAKPVPEPNSKTSSEMGFKPNAWVSGSIEGVAAEIGIGVPTLRDGLLALRRAAKDPREDLLGVPPPQVLTFEDASTGGDRVGDGNVTNGANGGGGIALDELVAGVSLTGIVKNVVDFGAFVDLEGLPCDGLLHISQYQHELAYRGRIIVGAKISVRVISVEILNSKAKRARISLGMIGFSA